MKICFLFVILFLFANNSSAQSDNNKFHIQALYSNGIVQSSFYTNYSLRGEFLTKRNVGFNYNFDFMVRKDSINQFHSSMGVLGAPVLFGIGIIKSIDSDTTTKGAWGIIGGILLLILPDGISYHFSTLNNWDIAPYANILGLDFVNDRKIKHRELKYSCSFGIKFTRQVFNNISISAFLETRQAANYGWSIGGGVGLGYLIDKKSKNIDR